jgi:hypothetical protein
MALSLIHARAVALCALVPALVGCEDEPGPRPPAASAPAPATEEAVAPPAEQADPGADLLGTWTGSLRHESVSGPCPATPAQQGTVEIARGAEGLTMRLGEGFRCAPASACVFAFTVEDGAMVARNAGAADDEGGTHGTELRLSASADEQLMGTGSSTYSHPGGMDCRWTTTLNLTRAGG